jgi:hypothetical protein
MFVQNGNLPNCHSPLQQKLQNIPWCYISFHWKMKQVTFDITTTITRSLTHDQQNMNKVIIEIFHKVNTYVSQDMNIIVEMFHMFNGKT